MTLVMAVISTKLQRASYSYETIATVAIKSAFSIVSRDVEVHRHIPSVPKSDTQASSRGTMYPQGLTFLWPGTVQTSPKMLLERSFYKYKKVG